MITIEEEIEFITDTWINVWMLRIINPTLHVQNHLSSFAKLYLSI